MAKILNKDPATYQRERECFLRDLQQFHETRGTPFRKIPKINGHEIDLYLLYVLVTAHGGWVKVNSRNEWELLVENFCLPKHCVNSGVGLKQIYCRYLDRYEKVNYLGEDVERGSDDDEDSRHRRWSARALHSVPLTYNHHQHNVAENLRTYNGLSANLYKPTDYDRLALSLMSPLPNEQDFAINVCTLLSNEGKHTLRLDKYPRLVDFLLAHAGIYSYPGMREYFEDIYCNVREHSLRSFWMDVIEDPSLCDLIDESKFIPKKDKSEASSRDKKDSSSNDDSTKSGTEKPGEKFPVYWADGSSKKDATDDPVGKIVLPGKVDVKVEVGKLGSTEDTTNIDKKEFVANVDACSGKVSDVISVSSTSDKSSELPVDVQICSAAPGTSQKEVNIAALSVEDVEMTGDGILDRTLDNKDGDETKSKGRSESVLCGSERTGQDEKMDVDVKCECPALSEATNACGCGRTEVGSVGRAMGMEYEEGEDGLLQEKPAAGGRSPGKNARLTILPDDQELFCLWRTLGTQDYVGQRVLQVATILRNLSFVEENVPVLGCNFAFLRFLLLCARSRWSSLHQVGLDMLGNVAQEIHVEDPASDRYSGWLVSSVSLGVSSQDRFVVLSCLEVLNKLSQREDNEDVMLRCIDQKVYDQVCQFLTLHDIMLLIYTLECLYSLSSLGERACNCIARVHGAIDTLVSLITVEAQSYGPRACILMRVVETVSGVQSVGITTTNTTTSAMSGATPAPAALPMTSQLRPSAPITPHRQATPHKMVIGAPQPAVATPVSMGASHQAVSQQYFHQQHQQQQQQQQQQFVHQQAVQENEQFALAWLRSAYEPSTGSRLEQGEVYKQYLTACAKVGRRGVIAPLHFPRCVRSVFGSNVGPIQQKSATSAGGSGGSSEQMLSFYEGIKVRANPFPIGVLQASGVAPATHPPTPRKPFPVAQHVVSVPKTVTPPPPAPSPVRTTPPPPPPPPLAPSTSPSPSTAAPTPALPAPAATAPATTSAPAAPQPPTVGLVLDTAIPIVPAPASPILKAQLSAPPKPRDSSAKGDVVKSQVLAHPHLTQALLGGGASGQGQGAGAAPSKEGGACNNSTSLIKSLLATKVTPAGDSPAQTSSMMPASVCAGSNSSPQVTQRQQQQKLLQQQLQCQETGPTSPPPLPPPQPVAGKAKAIVCVASKAAVDQRRAARMNGARTPIPVQAQLDGGKETNNNGTSSSVPSEAVTVIVSDQTAVPRIVENHASAAGGGSAVLKGRREPPQPPPPLALVSSGPPRLPTPAPDDSDNSRASSSRDCSGLNASTDDGENSLTSFEGFLLNGMPNSIDIDAASNDSSASKDSARSGVLVGKTLHVGGKSLMLADLLEKKVDKKEPPVLNGIIGKELRIGEKGLELVENHLEKVLKESVNVSVTIETSTGEMIETTTGEVLKEMSEEGLIRLAGPFSNNCGEKDNSAAYKTVGTTTDENVTGSSDGVKCAAVQTQTVQGVKRPAERNEGDVGVLEAKRPHLESATVNGTSSPIPVLSLPEDTSKESDASEPVGASTSAANLYAALAASTIEDEPDLDIEPTPQIQLAGRQAVFLGQGMDATGQQLIVTTPRQIIVSQGQLASQNQVLISAGGQLTLQQGGGAKIKAPASHQTMPMLVQTGNAQPQRTQITAMTPQGAQIVQAGQVVLTQSSSGQFILSQTPPNQMQLVTGTSQGSQYIVSGGTAAGQAHYVMAQPQTALVQGQSQTVLVAQTPQQQGTGTKTIIILQPQSSAAAAAAAHHQKVMMTSQGQQVVVTQVPRPILQNPAPSLPPPALVPTSGASMVTSSTSNASTNATQTPQKHLQLQQQQQTTGLPAKLLANTVPSTQPARLPISHTSQIIVSASGTSSATTSVIHQTPVVRPAGHVSAPATPGLVQPRPPRPLTPTPAIRPPPSQPSAATRPAVAASSPQRVVKTYQNPRIAQAQVAGAPESKSISVQHNSPQQLKTIRPSVTVQSQTRPAPSSGTPVDHAVFLCEWRGCMRSFTSANEVYLHACEAHCPLGSEEIQCLWERCDAMRRKRLSLMTHLYDRHCNADVLRMMAVRRKQLSQSGRSEIPPPQPPPPHPGYAPNAAFHAIKRHALEFVNPKEMMKAAPASIQARTGPSPPEQDDNEGPVTKSIRLTSSLILRNLVIYSTNGRRFLRSYEPHLASIALSNVESSRTIAQVLYDMNQQTSSQR